MSKLMLSADTLNALLAQATANGNTELAAQIESAIQNAERVKSPEDVETLADAVQASKEGRLTIRKQMVKEAARLLVHLATCVANLTVQERILKVLEYATDEEQEDSHE